MDRRKALEDAVRVMAPRIPRHEFEAVMDHALGSRGLHMASPEKAAWLSLAAYIRHRLTEYDQLLNDGYDMQSARFFVLGDINAVLESWGSPRRVGEEAEEGLNEDILSETDNEEKPMHPLTKPSGAS